MRSRRGTFVAFAIGLCSLAVGGPAAIAGDAIRIGYVSTSQTSIPVIVADAKGLFREEGLDVTLMPFDSAQPVAVAIAAGDVDFGTMALTSAFFVLANQGGLKVIAGDTTEHPGFHGLGFLASNQAYAAGVKSIADLSGHSIGITQLGTPLQYSLSMAIGAYHIDTKSVRILGLQSNANIASAITGGQVDAAVLSSSNLLAVTNRSGGKFLGWLEDVVHGTSVTGTVTAAAIANNRPETAGHFLAAILKAGKLWDAAFVDAAGHRADQPTAPEMIALAAKGLNQPPDVIVQGLNYVEPELRVPVGDIQRMLDWYEAQGMQKTHIDVKAVVDMRYAKLVAPTKDAKDE